MKAMKAMARRIERQHKDWHIIALKRGTVRNRKVFGCLHRITRVSKALDLQRLMHLSASGHASPLLIIRIPWNPI